MIGGRRTENLLTDDAWIDDIRKSVPSSVAAFGVQRSQNRVVTDEVKDERSEQGCNDST